MPGFQSFFKDFLHHFVLAKLATSSIRVNLLIFREWVVHTFTISNECLMKKKSKPVKFIFC